MFSLFRFHSQLVPFFSLPLLNDSGIVLRIRHDYISRACKNDVEARLVGREVRKGERMRVSNLDLSHP